MTTLYDAIQTAWNEFGEATKDCEPFQIPLSARPLEKKARELDNRFADVINPLIEQYNDGLITGIELLNKMTWEAQKEV